MIQFAEKQGTVQPNNFQVLFFSFLIVFLLEEECLTHIAVETARMAVLFRKFKITKQNI